MRVSTTAMGVIGLLAVTTSAAEHAPAEGSLVSRIEQCRTLQNDSARLACLDAIVLDKEPQGSPGGSSSQAAGRDQGFGDEFLRRMPPDDPEEVVSSIAATISRVDKRPRGEYVFFLDNDQVWTELEKGRQRYREGLAITIERTPFGGYMLSAEQGGRATRVKRLE